MTREEPRPEGPIEHLARLDVESVLAEARPEARAQAKEELVRLLRGAIVDHALAGADAATDTGSGTAHREQTGLYAYAVIRSGGLDLTGVAGIADDAPPYKVEQDDLALVVSEIRLSELDDVSADEVTEDSRLALFARRHDSVVRAAVEQGPTLPMRFGTIVADLPAARRLLRDHDRAARESLAAVDGHREWGARVCATADGDHAAEADELTGDRTQPATGTEYLSRRRDALTERQREADLRRRAIDEAHRALAACASDSVERTAASGDVYFDVAYLVARSREAEFFAEADRVADRLRADGMELATTGPWPPYSFVRAAFEETTDG